MSKKSTKSNYSVSEKLYGVSVAEYYTTFLHLVISLIRKTHKHHKCHLTLFKNQNTMFPQCTFVFIQNIPLLLFLFIVIIRLRLYITSCIVLLPPKWLSRCLQKLQFLPDENIQDVAQISYVNKIRWQWIQRKYNKLAYNYSIKCPWYSVTRCRYG